jgi:uncharacterized membrane protein YhaH (DUF805 family)
MTTRLPRVPRLRRRSYWLWTITTWLVFFGVREGVDLQHLPMAATAWAAVAVLAIFALSAARLHDRNRGAGWLLIALIPVLGVAWLACELALRRGTPNANRYGPDPHRP